MNRAERRAAAHAARKAERKAGFPLPQQQPQAELETSEPDVPVTAAEQQPEPVSAPTQNKREISDAQREANIRNAQKSTGPTSTAGLQKISQNALKTGLTGRQVLLPEDDAALYETMVRDYQALFEPLGPEETALLQSIVDTRWRLSRFPGLESAAIDLGKRMLVEADPELAENPAPVLEMQARSHVEKKLRNLELQENRLVRRREREMKELRELQAIRKAEEKEKAAKAESAKPNPVNAPIKNGFVFSTTEIAAYLATLTPEAREIFVKEVLTSAASNAETMQNAA